MLLLRIATKTVALAGRTGVERFDLKRIVLSYRRVFLVRKMLPFVSLVNIDGGDTFSMFVYSIFLEFEPFKVNKGFCLFKAQFCFWFLYEINLAPAQSDHGLSLTALSFVS